MHYFEHCNLFTIINNLPYAPARIPVETPDPTSEFILLKPLPAPITEPAPAPNLPCPDILPMVPKTKYNLLFGILDT